MSLPLLVTGTIGIDTILTPRGRAEGVLGGSVSFAAVAALLFADRVDAVSIIGEDFPAHYEEALAAKGLCMDGVERKKGPSFSWTGEYVDNMNKRRTVCANDSVMLEWNVHVPESLRSHPVLVEAGAYRDVGGHAAVRGVLHDGLALARRLRAGGHGTEVVDGAPLADCRMYDGFRESWRGFVKNAREGMATPVGLPVWTLLLGGGHVLPWLLLPAVPAAAALVAGYAIRAAITWRGQEPSWTIPLHPATVAVALLIQWTALFRSVLGRPAGWKGRLYSATGEA